MTALAPAAYQINHVRKGKEIIELTAKAYKLTPISLINQDRRPSIVHARQVAYWLLRQNRFSFPQIGRMMKRDHSTVMHGCKCVEASIKAAPDLRDELLEIVA